MNSIMCLWVFVPWLMLDMSDIPMYFLQALNSRAVKTDRWEEGILQRKAMSKDEQMTAIEFTLCHILICRSVQSCENLQRDKKAPEGVKADKMWEELEVWKLLRHVRVPGGVKIDMRCESTWRYGTIEKVWQLTRGLRALRGVKTDMRCGTTERCDNLQDIWELKSVKTDKYVGYWEVWMTCGHHTWCGYIWLPSCPGQQFGFMLQTYTYTFIRDWLLHCSIDYPSSHTYTGN